MENEAATEESIQEMRGPVFDALRNQEYKTGGKAEAGRETELTMAAKSDDLLEFWDKWLEKKEKPEVKAVPQVVNNYYFVGKQEKKQVVAKDKGNAEYPMMKCFMGGLAVATAFFFVAYFIAGIVG